WEPQTHPKNFFPLAFSHDRKTILKLESERPGAMETIVRLRDSITGQPVGRELRHHRPILLEGVAAFPGQRHPCSSDRRRALTLDVDNVSRLWDVESAEVIQSLKPWSEQPVQEKFFAAAFSPDSKFVVTGTYNSTAQVWDADTGKLLHELQHDPGGVVFNAAFS